MAHHDTQSLGPSILPSLVLLHLLASIRFGPPGSRCSGSTLLVGFALAESEDTAAKQLHLSFGSWRVDSF